MRISTTMMAIAALAPLLLAISACQGSDEAAAPNNAGNVTDGEEAAAPSPQASPVKIESSDEVLEFAYGWPAEAAAIAPLDQWLRSHAADRRARMETMAREGAADARENGYPVRQYGFSQTWSVVADTPALLVLESEGYEYTGGAHGMPFVSTIVWDKEQGARLPLSALLDVPALSRIAKDRFCAALDAERAKKRNTPERAAIGGNAIPEFSRCVDMAKQEIVPVSQGGQAIDLLRVEIMPYEAGPYAEGIYTIDLPVDEALMAAVKPEWKGAFAPR